MQSALFLSALVGASALDLSAPVHSRSASMIAEINAKATTWKAGPNRKFENATLGDVKMLLGTVLPHEENYLEPELEKKSFLTATAAIPEAFDVRTNWPECAAITGMVRDQSNCGSCWAFGSTEAYNDRRCIQTGDATTVLSPEDTLACCTGLKCGFSMGCNGGQPSGAWKYFTTEGVTTGGNWEDVNTGKTCKPYGSQSCAHHVESEDYVSCEDVEAYKTPKCTSECSDASYATPYAKDKYFAKTSYSVKTEENMQKELMEKGTLSVSLTVYEDFEAYTSGVYQHTTGRNLGGHAIKMVGWGVDNGTPYWTCVNSWNDSWGEDGIFRILRGSDECGIEGGVVAGDA